MKFFHKKSLGQHFLNSPVVPNWMCDAADLEVGDLVVEIGPGTGALTEALLERGAKVIALETDQRAIDILEEKFLDKIVTKQLILEKADARKLDFGSLGLKSGGFKIVSNIPYYLSGMLFRSCLSSDIQPKTLVFLVQKEVAARIVEPLRGGKQSLLSLSVATFGNPTYIRTVSKGHFNPPPKIDSAILKVADISQENLKDINKEQFFELLHLGFGQKRKQLRNNLQKELGKERVEEAFSALGLPNDVRAEDLSLAIWLKLAASL